MAMETKDNMFYLSLPVTSKNPTDKILKTGGKYVDKDIKLDLSVEEAKFSASNATVTAKVSTTDTTYTSDVETDYPITIAADAQADAVTVSTTTAGFTESGDSVTVAAANAEQKTKTIYVKAGALQKVDGSVSVTSDGKVDLGSKLSAAPNSGYYIKATSDGSVGVGAAGWLPTTATAVDTDAEAYYTIASASLGNAETTGQTYTTKNAPVLVSGSGLYINEGYIENTYIPLADLVPDEATVVAGTDGNSNLIYKTISVYDKDGTLIAGTMGDATLSDITASNVKSDITTVTVTAKSDSSAFDVTASGSISGDSSVAIATTGYATTELSKTGSISGTASVNATLAKVGLGGDAENTSVQVTPVITVENTSNAQHGTVTTTQPTEGHYVVVDTAAISATAKVTPKVTTAGYGTTDVYSATATEVTAGAAASGAYYVPIQEGSHTATKQNSSITKPSTTVTPTVSSDDTSITPNTVTTKATGKKYIAFDAKATTSAGSVTTSVLDVTTEGYITASSNTISTQVDVAVEDANSSTVYIEIFDGTVVDATTTAE